MKKKQRQRQEIATKAGEQDAVITFHCSYPRKYFTEFGLPSFMCEEFASMV